MYLSLQKNSTQKQNAEQNSLLILKLPFISSIASYHACLQVETDDDFLVRTNHETHAILSFDASDRLIFRIEMDKDRVLHFLLPGPIEFQQ